MNKEITISDLNDKINELNHKIINMKEMFKIDSQKDLLIKNDEIITLKNKIEINQKKMDFQEKKFQNLQYKYLRLLRDKKNEKENLFFSFNENLSSVNLIKNKSNLNKRLNSFQKNIFSTPNRLSDDKPDINRITTLFEQTNNNNTKNNHNLNDINKNNNNINQINNIKSINNNIKNNFLNNINEINVNINNTGEYNTIQNNKRYLSPNINLINKNEDKDKNTNNLLPLLNNERNISLKKEPKRKLKLIENFKDKNCIKKKISKTHNWRELNKIIKTESNK